jgi:hypothetical protein
MNFLIFSLCLSATISYALAPPPRWVTCSLVAIALLTGIMLHVS